LNNYALLKDFKLKHKYEKGIIHNIYKDIFNAVYYDTNYDLFISQKDKFFDFYIFNQYNLKRFKYVTRLIQQLFEENIKRFSKKFKYLNNSVIDFFIPINNLFTRNFPMFKRKFNWQHIFQNEGIVEVPQINELNFLTDFLLYEMIYFGGDKTLWPV